MKIVILGAGCIGGFIGGMLHSQGQSPIIIGRENRLAPIAQSDKFSITDYSNNRATIESPTLIFNNDCLKDADLVILTVKCTDIEASVKVLEDYCKAGVFILCLQNGMGSHHSLEQAAKKHQWHIIQGLVSFNVVIKTKTVSNTPLMTFHKASEGDIYFDSSSLLETSDIYKLLSDVKFGTTQFIGIQNYSALAWAKLQLNLNNAINALADIPLKSQLKNRQYRLILSAAMKELLMVCKHNHITLPKITRLPAALIPWALQLPDIIFNRVASSMLDMDDTARSSMWDDITHGRKTEVDFINGAVASIAKKDNLFAPVNETLQQFIHKKENKEIMDSKSFIHDFWKEVNNKKFQEGRRNY